MILPGADGPYEVPAHVRLGLFAKYSTYGRGIDVDRELALAALWLEKNPSRRPKNVLRFLEAWLQKCNGVGPTRKGGQRERVTRGAQSSPKGTPPSNGAAATDPPVRLTPSAPSLALATAAAPPTIRSSNGPRSMADILAGFKAQIGVKT